MGTTISSFLRGTAFATALILAVVPYCAQAQLRNANWIFAQNHVSFTSGTAVATAVEVPPYRPFNSLSDPTGTALVHAVHTVVLNAQLDTMSGCPALDTGEGIQGFLFLPFPGDTNDLAFFHNHATNFGCELSFGRIDLAQDNGLGAFVGGMTLLNNWTASKLTAVAHANGQDYWVLTQILGTDEIAAYLLSATGVDSVPVISHTGVPMIAQFDGTEAVQDRGAMVASYTGDRLAMAGLVSSNVEPYTLDHARIEVLHFDNATGSATHAASIPPPTGNTINGIEFSPDGSKLYFTSKSALELPITSTLHQYDLSVQDEAAIIASHTVIFTEEVGSFDVQDPFGQLALAPDRRIWFIRWPGSPWLGVIESPNEAGAACTPVMDQLLLPHNAGAGLPSQCKRYHDSELTHTGIPASEEAGTLMTWPNPAQTLLNINAPEPGCTSQLYDATGRLVLSTMHGPRRTATVDVAGLPAGPFLVRCTDALGNGWTSTMLKE